MIGDSYARSKGFQRVVGVTVQAVVAVTSDTDNASLGAGVCEVYIRKAAVPFAIYGFRKIDFPAKSIIKRELRGDSIGILAIKEPALLAFSGSQAGAHKAIKGRYISQ